ncbi:MAG: cytochrome b/b6 domain-containing protein [Polyangiaceae bacterium]|nr:cytochrome b/b6 domain-containing protein [Polyangiaceae bacterium]
MRRTELYTLYERLWHWLQALVIILLSITGFEIHAPDTLHLFGFVWATRIHEVCALITIANGFLSLFYHVATGAIRQYFPPPKDIFSLGAAQASYYLFGIFKGAPHPFVRRPERKLNVLQQLTYLAILNVLLPVQVVTGALMWQASRIPGLVQTLGGLGTLATIHVAAAWLFVAFVIMHVYLATTGSTPLSHIRSMITGYDEEPEAELSHEVPDAH